MRRIKFFAGAVIMAAFVFTGCIDNEESEGVKSLRKAQAGLIEAKAYQTTLEARADSAYEAVQLRIEVAQAIIAEANAALQVAQSENEMATLSVKLEIEMLRQNALLADEENNLARAQKDLEIALSDYEAELAEDKAKNKNLDRYLTSYRNALNMANGLQIEIIGLQANLVKAGHFALNSNLTPSGNIVELKEREKATLERTLALNEDWLAKAEEVHGNTTDRHAVIVEARESIQSLIKDIDAIDVAIAVLNVDLEVLSVEYANALTAYGDAVEAEDKIEAFTDGAGGTIPQQALETITEIPEDGPSSFASLETLNASLVVEMDSLALLQEERTASNSQLTRAKAIKNQYGNALTVAETAVENAEKAVYTAEHNLNMAELQLATDPANATFQANVATRQTQLNDANTAYNDALQAYNDLVSQINMVGISLSDYYEQHYVGDNIATIDWLIEKIEGELEAQDVVIADKQEDIAEVTADIAIVEGYIAYLQTVDAGDVEALRAAYFAARATYWAKTNEKADLNIDKALLNTEKTYATTLEAELMGNYTSVNTLIDNLKDAVAGNKAAIANLDADFASWDSYIVALQERIAQKQVEHTIRQNEAAKYKALIDIELN